MKTKDIGEITFNEYILKLEPEEENLLIEIGQREIVKNNNECINYAVQFLLEKYMKFGSED